MSRCANVSGQSIAIRRHAETVAPADAEIGKKRKYRRHDKREHREL